jgi:hypothetical protein
LFDASPALFVENQGQWADPTVRYGFDGVGTAIAFGEKRAGLRNRSVEPRKNRLAGSSDGAVAWARARKAQVVRVVIVEELTVQRVGGDGPASVTVLGVPGKSGKLVGTVTGVINGRLEVEDSRPTSSGH